MTLTACSIHSEPEGSAGRTGGSAEACSASRAGVGSTSTYSWVAEAERGQGYGAALLQQAALSSEDPSRSRGRAAAQERGRGHAGRLTSQVARIAASDATVIRPTNRSREPAAETDHRNPTAGAGYPMWTTAATEN